MFKVTPVEKAVELLEKAGIELVTQEQVKSSDPRAGVFRSLCAPHTRSATQAPFQNFQYLSQEMIL